MFIKNSPKNGKFVSCNLPLLLLPHTLAALHGSVQCGGSLSKRLPGRMAMIFDVSVSEHDGLPFPWVLASSGGHRIQARCCLGLPLHGANDIYVIVYGLFYTLIY